MSPEEPTNPFNLEDDTPDKDDDAEVAPDYAGFHHLEIAQMSPLAIEKEIREAFLKKENIEKVISAIDKDREMYNHFRSAQLWLIQSKMRDKRKNKDFVVDKFEPSDGESLVAMIVRMLFGSDGDHVGADDARMKLENKIQLYLFYKKLGLK